MKEEASRLISDAHRKHEEALLKSEKIIQEAKIESENMIKAAQDKIEEEISKKIEVADKRLKDEQERIIRATRQKVVKKAVENARNYFANDFDDKQNEKLVESKLQDLKDVKIDDVKSS